MTITGWSLIRFLHVLAAMCWVGGQLILSLIVLPALRRSSLAPDVRVPLVRAAAKRFGMVANVALLPTLLATGLALAAHRHLSWEILGNPGRSEEHTSELQSLMRIPYAVFCLKKKTTTIFHKNVHT